MANSSTATVTIIISGFSIIIQVSSRDQSFSDSAQVLFILGGMIFGASATTITGNSDLDSYTNAGCYRVADTTSARAIANIPYASTGGNLVVVSAYAGANYKIQLYFCIRAIYARRKNNTWSEWVEVCSFT